MAKVRKLTSERRRRMVALLRGRDGDACWYCSKPIAEGAETLEHLLARSLGGLNAPENLVLVHLRCNVSLRTHPPGEKLKMRAIRHRKAGRVAEEWPIIAQAELEASS